MPGTPAHALGCPLAVGRMPRVLVDGDPTCGDAPGTTVDGGTVSVRPGDAAGVVARLELPAA
jgi:hypothetical protein